MLEHVTATMAARRTGQPVYLCGPDQVQLSSLVGEPLVVVLPVVVVVAEGVF